MALTILLQPILADYVRLERTRHARVATLLDPARWKATLDGLYKNDFDEDVLLDIMLRMRPRFDEMMQGAVNQSHADTLFHLDTCHHVCG